METEDIISLLADSPENGGEGNGHNQRAHESFDLNGIEEVPEAGELPGSSEDNADGHNKLLSAPDNCNSMLDDPPSSGISSEPTKTIAVNGKENPFVPLHADNGSLAVKDETLLSNHKEDEFPLSVCEIGASSLSGFKRSRVTVDEEQPFIKVTYKSLTRDSKRKLKELLQQWSQWHAKHCSLSPESGKALESGEDTYFPAIQVGRDKPSAVSFWMENEVRNYVKKELFPLDDNSVPLYDRGFSLALTSTDGSSNQGGLELVEGSRCFNCGSYNHSFKDCSKPRDNVAVNNARKQHKARRNQSASSRNATRYYHNSPGGKYDGLKPGTLDSETRQLLGLKELDPPPWLNRMRELGYPPGYLEPEDEEDQPSGITIFGDDENEEDKEEGEILEESFIDPVKKWSVKFPGINAPIPKDADERLWATGVSDRSLYRDRSHTRHNLTTDFGSRSHYHGQRLWRGFEDDEPPPPGCEDERSTFSAESRRYGGLDATYYSHSPRDSPMPRSSSFGRSLSGRVGRNPELYDDSPAPYSYGSFPYSSPR